MEYDYIEDEGTLYCNVSIDKSRTVGILRFSHEISVTFAKIDGEWKFDGAWHIGVEDCEWNSSEEESFEETFPGLLAEMKEGLA